MAATVLPDAGGEEEEGIVAEINVTPLTDIFLVLLIIFMVTSSVIVEEGKNIDLPNAEVSDDTPPEGVVVQMNIDGQILVNDKVIPTGQVQKALELAIEEAEDKIVVLKGDQGIMLGRAVNVLDLAQKAGAEGIAISTEDPTEPMEIQ